LPNIHHSVITAFSAAQIKPNHRNSYSTEKYNTRVKSQNETPKN
jgi:hypothetical protein